MKQITVTIPNNKEGLFIELMKNLSFVKKVETTQDTSIPEWHEAIIDQRTENYLNEPESFKEWNEVKKEINKKNGLLQL